MAQTDKAAPDWERIEADYRAGVLSIREIAASQGITEGAIRKRAKRDDWSRDLKAKIQAKADDLVRKQEVRNAVRANMDERTVIEAGAESIARIKLAHRTDIARFRRLAMAMLDELEVMTADNDLFIELGEILRADDDRGQDRRNEVYQRAISSSQRIDSLKKLADTLKTLVALERESYGIVEGQQQQQTDPTALLKAIADRLPD
jgi:hypothetical protein